LQYTISKKLTIPLRLFGQDKDARTFPPTLLVTALLENGSTEDMGDPLILKFEDRYVFIIIIHRRDANPGIKYDHLA
jgi:hypothetical protein